MTIIAIAPAKANAIQSVSGIKSSCQANGRKCSKLKSIPSKEIRAADCQALRLIAKIVEILITNNASPIGQGVNRLPGTSKFSIFDCLICNFLRINSWAICLLSNPKKKPATKSIPGLACA